MPNVADIVFCRLRLKWSINIGSIRLYKRWMSLLWCHPLSTLAFWPSVLIFLEPQVIICVDQEVNQLRLMILFCRLYSCNAQTLTDTSKLVTGQMKHSNFTQQNWSSELLDGLNHTKRKIIYQKIKYISIKCSKSHLQLATEELQFLILKHQFSLFSPGNCNLRSVGRARDKCDCKAVNLSVHLHHGHIYIIRGHKLWVVTKRTKLQIEVSFQRSLGARLVRKNSEVVQASNRNASWLSPRWGVGHVPEEKNLVQTKI